MFFGVCGQIKVWKARVLWPMIPIYATLLTPSIVLMQYGTADIYLALFLVAFTPVMVVLMGNKFVALANRSDPMRQASRAAKEMKAAEAKHASPAAAGLEGTVTAAAAVARKKRRCEHLRRSMPLVLGCCAPIGYALVAAYVLPRVTDATRLPCFYAMLAAKVVFNRAVAHTFVEQGFVGAKAEMVMDYILVNYEYTTALICRLFIFALPDSTGILIASVGAAICEAACRFVCAYASTVDGMDGVNGKPGIREWLAGTAKFRTDWDTREWCKYFRRIRTDVIDGHNDQAADSFSLSFPEAPAINIGRPHRTFVDRPRAFFLRSPRVGMYPTALNHTAP